MRVELALVLLLCACVTIRIDNVEGKAQYVQSLNSGLQMAIPWDIANVFIRPIAASTVVFLSIAMLCILFFGVITSPFGYMFGIPSRKYVLGGPTDALHSQVARSLSDAPDFGLTSDETLGGNSTNADTNYDLDKWDKVKHLDFMNSALFLLPDVDTECNLLLVCYAHGVFRKLPPSAIKLYRFFSRKLLNADENVQKAVKTGLGGFKQCQENYSGCPFSPFKLTIKTFRSLIPEMW